LFTASRSARYDRLNVSRHGTEIDSEPLEKLTLGDIAG
jgi:hypothetical protein